MIAIVFVTASALTSRGRTDDSGVFCAKNPRRDLLFADEALSGRLCQVFFSGAIQGFFWREVAGTDQRQPVAQGGTGQRRSRIQ